VGALHIRNCSCGFCLPNFSKEALNLCSSCKLFSTISCVYLHRSYHICIHGILTCYSRAMSWFVLNYIGCAWVRDSNFSGHKNSSVSSDESVELFASSFSSAVSSVQFFQVRLVLQNAMIQNRKRFMLSPRLSCKCDHFLRNGASLTFLNVFVQFS
jgi:hypothetical protein